MSYQKTNSKKHKIQQKIINSKSIYKKNNTPFIDIILEKPWDKYIPNLEFFHEKKNFLTKGTLEKKKEIIGLNKDLEDSKLSPFFFKPWIKDKKIFLTKRQSHLNELYAQYSKGLYLKERKNFLKTYLGEILKTSYLHSPTLRGLWVRARILARYKTKRKNQKFSLKKVPWLLAHHHTKQYKTLKASTQKGWLYESLLKKEQSRNAIYFELDRPHTAFQNHFKQQAKEPWIDPLIFKRWAYFGFIERNRKEIKDKQFKLKDYLRKRNPRSQKRNKLYWWRRNLLFKFYLNNQIRKKKWYRIKQILTKIYLPFYGNLNRRQLSAVLKKTKKKKSQLLNKNETILSSLENRLDVVVYRLNLAPNVLWARRLIQEGSIFVSNIFSFQNWILMYSQIKHYMFPLKLRDPKNLYKTNQWNPAKKISKFKFLLKPIKKIHYLVKSGDLIQSAKTLTINKPKNNRRLFKKPIIKNLYTIKKIKRYFWHNSSQAPKTCSVFKWQEPAKEMTASLFLFNARFTDLKTNDRAKELFFRWVTL